MCQANKGALTLGTYGVCVETPSSHRRRGHRGCLCAQYLSPCHSWDEGTHSCRWTASLTRECTCTHIATSLPSYVSPVTQASPCFPTCSHIRVCTCAFWHRPCSIPTHQSRCLHTSVDGLLILTGFFLGAGLPPSFRPLHPHSKPTPIFKCFLLDYKATENHFVLVTDWGPVSSSAYTHKHWEKMLIVLLFFFV